MLMDELEARNKLRTLFKEGLEFLDIFREIIEEIKTRKKQDEIAPRTARAYDSLMADVKNAIKTCNMNSI